jgi:hypothetical protein
MNDMRNFVFRAIMISFTKKEKYMIFVFELNFHNLKKKKKKLMLIKLLSTTLSPLGLTFFNCMLPILVI